MYFICTGIMLILDKLMTIVVAIGDPQSHCNFYYILFTILFFIQFFKFVITNYLILNLRIFYFEESLIQTLQTKRGTFVYIYGPMNLEMLHLKYEIYYMDCCS